MSYDWNGNGHHDPGDDFIGYNIYKDVTDGNNSGSSSGQGGAAKWVVLAIIAIFLSFFYH